MALAPLATAADLAARSIDTANTGQVDAALAAASASIREAAGCAITSTTSTIKLPAPDDQYLRLPAGPVTAVTEVLLDGAAVTDYTIIDDALWRPPGWLGLSPASFFLYSSIRMPVVQVTYTHGLDAVPDDLVDLCCALAAAALETMGSGYGARSGIASERIDDYQVTFVGGTDAMVSPVQLPRATRDWLRHRFGGGAAGVMSMR